MLGYGHHNLCINLLSWQYYRLQTESSKRHGGRVIWLSWNWYDALRALLCQTTTYEVFMEAHLELFPETYKTLKEINKKLNP